MKVGLALEGLLVDIDSAFATWQSRQGGASSYLDPKVVRDESFWASLRCQQTIGILKDIENVYVLTERPPSLFLVTRSWLRRNDILIPEDNIIMRSSGTLKRYDCRLYDLDYFIDSDIESLSAFVYDRCIPVGIGEGYPEWIRSYPTLEDVKFDTDLRKWSKYEKVP